MIALRTLALLLVVVLGYGTAMAGEAAVPPAPTPAPAGAGALRAVVLLDASRSSTSPNNLDRITAVVDGLLRPRLRTTVWAFTDKPQQIERWSELPAPGRASDYLVAFSEGLLPLLGDAASGPVLALVLGDGHQESFTDQPPQAYIDWAKAANPAAGAPTRPAINQAVRQQLLATFAPLAGDPRLRLALCDTAPAPDPSSLFAALSLARQAQAQGVQFHGMNTFSLGRMVASLDQMGLEPSGSLAPVGALPGKGGQGAQVLIGEGCELAELWVHTPGEQAAYSVRFAVAGGPELPLLAAGATSPGPGPWIEVWDDQGVARHYLLHQAESGLALHVLIKGPSQPYEVLALTQRSIEHRMQLVWPADESALWSGAEAGITHSFTISATGSPVSPELAAVLTQAMQIEVSGQYTLLPPGNRLLLPAPGQHSLRASFDPRLGATRGVRSQPLGFTTVALSPLRITGGFSERRVLDDTAVDLLLERSGGRWASNELSVLLRWSRDGTDLGERRLRLRSSAEAPNQFRSVLRFTNLERGTWSLVAAQADPREGMVAPLGSDGRHLQLRSGPLEWPDWLIGLLAGAGALAALIGGWVGGRAYQRHRRRKRTSVSLGPPPRPAGEGDRHGTAGGAGEGAA